MLEKASRHWTLLLSALVLLLVSAAARAEVPAPVVTPGENQAVIFYHQIDNPDYSDWGLHLWNSENCDTLTEAQLAGVGWQTPLAQAGIDPNYGAYWLLDLKEPRSDCVNFIIHKGDQKAMAGAEGRLDLSQGHSGFVFHASATIYYQPLLTPPAPIGGFSAHWLERNTLVWPLAADAAEVTMYSSRSGAIKVDPLTGEVSGGRGYPLSRTELDPLLGERFPYLAGAPAFHLEMDLARVKHTLRGQVMLVARDDTGRLLAASGTQLAGVLDDIYTSNSIHNDGLAKADAEQLGAIVGDGQIEFKLWAPTARTVRVQLYRLSERRGAQYFQRLGRVRMVQNEQTGVWSSNVSDRYKGYYYQYEVSVWHPQSGRMENLSVTDPYSLSLSTNSEYSQIVDLTDSSTKPQGWDGHQVPALSHPEAQVIYEAHVRDFSAQDASTEHKGQYLAFTESDSTPVQHLSELQQAGVSTLHLLPVFDIASVNEDPAQRVDLTDPLGKLCALQESELCGVYADETTIGELLAGLDPASSDAQRIMAAVRPIDSFNWGYDPYHFAVPEGSYATDPMGTTRIIEFRQMVKALHEQGLRVVMDVVYNHTYAAGLDDKSVLDKIVPGYYHRLNVDSGAVENSTCCANTATENRMMAKLMIDTLAIWAQQYGIDGFRFDLMGHQPLSAMQEALETVRSIDPDTYFYGEGWNFGEVQNDARFVQATQINLAGSGIGSFSDRLRDAVRGGGCCDSGEAIVANQGFASGLYYQPNNYNSGSDAERAALLHSTDLIRLGMAGNLSEFVLKTAQDAVVTGAELDYGGQPAGYSADPQEVINYVSKHDNQTLWDINQYKTAEYVSVQDRARMQLLALSTPLLGQGVPFIHMGSELLRSKSLERDSYDSGDWFNRVDFTATSNNWNVGLPREDKDVANWPYIPALIANPNTVAGAAEIELAKQRFLELVQIRQGSPLFSLPSAAEVQQRVDFLNIGSAQIPGLIAMTIDDGVQAGIDLDPNVDALLVVINASPYAQSIDVGTGEQLQLHPVLLQSADPRLAETQIIADRVEVPGLTVAVFVVPQLGAQGVGLPVRVKFDGEAPPYGDTTVYLRGSMNEWSESLPFSFVGDGIYTLETELAPQNYEFKIASSDWITVDFGGAIVSLELPIPLARGFGNAFFDVTEGDSYRWTLDASEPEAPVLTVVSASATAPFGDTQLFVRGSMNEWGIANSMRYAGEGRYFVAMPLSAGAYEFKIASEDWASVDLGAATTIALEQPLPLAVAGGNIQLDIPADERYLFLLQSDGINSQLTVAQDLPAPYGDTEIYVRGSLNDWGTADPLVYEGMGYYAATFTADAGLVEFKIASDDWSSVDYGIDGSLELGSAATAVAGGGNVMITLPQSGEYRLSLIHTDDGVQMLLELVTALEEQNLLISAAAEPLRERLPCNRNADPVCDLRLYQVMVESFVDGDPAHDYNVGWGNSHHKGDLRGVINSLDYIQSLGVNAIWLTPIFDSHAGEPQLRIDDSVWQDPEANAKLDATGYFARDYFSIDPNFGTLADARELVEQAHARGLYVFFDGVFGHNKGGVLPSPSGLTPIDASWDDPEYSGRTVDFSQPQSVAFFQEVATYWINELGIDGWRLDQANQVPVEAWREIRAAVESAAESRRLNGEAWGTLGYMVAEIWDGDGQQVADGAYGTTEEPALNSAFNFALRYSLAQVLATEESLSNVSHDQPASRLATEWGLGFTERKYPDHAMPNTMLSNHDLVRFGDLLQRAGVAQPEEDLYWQRHRMAFTTMAAISGPLTIYYGDELGDEVPGFDLQVTDQCWLAGLCDDHVSRSSAKVPGVSIDEAALDYRALALRDLVAQLMQLRQDYPSLARGARQHLFANDDLFIDLKLLGSERVLLVMNVGSTPYRVDLQQSALAGEVVSATELVSGTPIDVAAGIQFSVEPQQVLLIALQGPEVGPEPVDIHLRGSMNDWGMTTFNQVWPTLFATSTYLEAGLHEFKIASADWMSLSVGFAEAVQGMPGLPLLDVGNGNIGIEIAEAGMYDVLYHTDNTVVVLKQATLGTPIYLRGEMNAWDLSLPFEQLDSDHYQLMVTLEAGSYPFKLGSEEWMYANYGGGFSVYPEVPVALMWDMPYGNSLVLEVPVSGEYLLTLDTSDRLAPLFSIAQQVAPQEAPLGTDVHVRGDMNDWGMDTMQYLGQGRYAAELYLLPGDYQFKIASADWVSVDLGAPQVLIASAGLPLQPTDGGNLILSVAEEGRYKFLLALPEDGQSAPLLAVSAVKPLATPLLLRGDMNGWATDLPFEQVSAGEYGVSLFLSAGSYEFKLGTEDWIEANYGGPAELSAGSLYFMVGDMPFNPNAVLVVPADGQYRVHASALVGPAGSGAYLSLRAE